MTAINTIITAFDAMVPTLAENFEAGAHRTINSIFAEYDDTDRRFPSRKMRQYDFHRWTAVRGFCKMQGNLYTNNIETAKLRKAGKEYAKEQIGIFTRKLVAKLGNLTSCEVPKIEGTEFTVRGKIGKRTVVVEQRIVYKWSQYGRPFVQWPARIYVDEKFTPEAQFKLIRAKKL